MPDVNRRLHLRLFLASPGDVVDERSLARQVIEQAQYDSRWRGLITTEVIAWEVPGAVPMVATATPQASVAHGLPRPSECDIAIVIFWARVGTPLPPEYTKPDGTKYASGTEWEYLDAFDAAKRTGRPTVLVYRRIEDPALYASDPDRDEKLRQWGWVNGALDVCGNVWEWCSDGEDMNPPDGNCPYGYRAVRGGSWNFGHESAKAEVPNTECASYRFNSVGFRVAVAAD